MDFVSDWIDTARDVVTSPTSFFQDEDRRDGFGYPLKFAAFSFLITGVASALRIGIYGAPSEASLGTPVLAVIGLISSIIGGILGLLIGGGLIHIFVSLFGGENRYSETLAALEYASVLGTIGSVLSLIPLVGGLGSFALGIYGIYVQGKGIESFQDLSFGKSVLAIILPGIVVGIIAVVLAVTVFASLMAAGGVPP